MKQTRLAVLSLIIMSACFVAGSRAAQRATAEYVPSVGEQVLAFEKLRCDAVIRRDIKALAEMMADDVTYVHAGGIKQTKSEYLAYVAAGKVTYTAYSIDHAVVRVVGDAAVTHGIFKYVIGSRQPPARGESIYTGVYVHRNGQWRLTSWEATSKME